MKSALPLALACAIATPAAAANFPGPMQGQVIGMKTFSYGQPNFTLPPGNQTLVETNFPAPAEAFFVKQYDNTTLECDGLFDVVPAPTLDHVPTGDTVNISIRIDGGSSGYVNVAAASDTYGHLITIPDYYEFEGLSAGAHSVTVWMVSYSYRTAILHSGVANLQCREIAEPVDQNHLAPTNP